METLTIELNSPKARKLIDDLADLGIISVKSSHPSWAELWVKLDGQLPQTEPDISEIEIQVELQAYRQEKRMSHS